MKVLTLVGAIKQNPLKSNPRSTTSYPPATTSFIPSSHSLFIFISFSFRPFICLSFFFLLFFLSAVLSCLHHEQTQSLRSQARQQWSPPHSWQGTHPILDTIDSQYIRLPSPFEPYILRFDLQGASAVCRNGRFLTTYPFKGYIPISFPSDSRIGKSSIETSFTRT